MRSCLLFIQLLFLLSVTSNAQNYQPFSKNSYIYSFEGAGEYYKLTVDSVTATGADSVFHFNTIAHYYMSDSLDKFMCKSSIQIPEYKLGCENIFGSKMIKSIDNNYYFITTQDTFLIKAKPNLNTSWVFSKKKGITAFVKELTQENVMGNIDSVMVIQVSTGDIFKISKNFGLILGNILLRSPYSSLPEDILSIPYDLLTLKSIPSTGLGFKYPVFKDFFDFKVGDEFGFYSKEFSRYWENSSIKILEYERDSNIDKIRYKYEYKYYKIIYIGNMKHDTLKGKSILFDTINPDDYLFLNANSLQYTLTDKSDGTGFLFNTIKRNNFFKLIYNTYYYDSCTNLIGSIIDIGNSVTYTDRLGKTNMFSCCDYNYDLICYSINNKTDNSGKCPDLDKLLSVDENPELQTTFQISPNPATNEITIKASSKNNFSKSKDLIKITDIQGKIVHQQVIYSATVNQNEEVKIDVSTLQNGLYLLHFISGTGNVSSQKFIISK